MNMTGGLWSRRNEVDPVPSGAESEARFGEISDSRSDRETSASKAQRFTILNSTSLFRSKFYFDSIQIFCHDKMSEKAGLSTQDVPPQYLRLAFLVGKVPLVSSRYDDRISYALYIPPHAYNPNPTPTETQTDLCYSLPRLPLVVTIHGTGRDVNGTLSRFIPLADSAPCAILAPLFPCGLDDPVDLDSYKVLSSKTLRSDLTLLSIIDEVAYKWPGIETTKFCLAGFSGGGQFTQRFLYLYPERLHAVSIGAPGRVTKLDPEQAWPAGIGDVEKVFGRAISVESMREVKIQLVVGEEDTVRVGDDGFWQWVKQMRGKTDKTQENDKKAMLPTMNNGRMETLRDLHAAFESVGISAQFDTVPDAAHEALKMTEVVTQFLLPVVRERLIRHTLSQPRWCGVSSNLTFYTNRLRPEMPAPYIDDAARPVSRWAQAIQLRMYGLSSGKGQIFRMLWAASVHLLTLASYDATRPRPFPNRARDAVRGISDAFSSRLSKGRRLVGMG
ncbi:hypothetical protein ANO11243_092260 [Dothideomycetidae sp. 11243]|nr:hypothetical protein ANO11243_092260 [fungal sp. No.11243]